jgi:hypothetical protein
MNLNKTRTAESACVRATLIGDGSTTPKLTMELFHDDPVSCYVDSTDLRTMGKAFLKWADKLDAEEAKQLGNG